MKTRKAIFIIAVTLFFACLSLPALGQENFKKVGQSGMQYLKIGVGAEMVGRGEAGIAAVKGVSSIFWNPAGMAYLEGKEFAFSHNAWIADISEEVFAGAMSFDNIGTFGISLIWMNYGELKGTSVANSVSSSSKLGYIDEGTFKPVDLAFGLSYSRRISEQFSVGGQVKLLYQNYGHNTIVTSSGAEQESDNTLTAVSFDLGTLYYPGYKSLAFAMSIQNFSQDIKYHQEAFSPPLTFKLGLSMNLLDLFDSQTNSSLLAALDAIHPRDYTERINLGLEYNYLGLFQVRGGYRFNYDEANYTAGAGVRYSLASGMLFKLDFSYMIITTDRFTSPVQVTASVVF